VLEEKVIERVGDHKPIHIDVRIISATNKNLKELVDEGVFREDLYYRINTIPITVPSLRERKEDLPLLVESFFQRAKLKSGKNIEGISDDAMALMLQYHWPGNIRELKGAIEYAFVSCQEKDIRPPHLPPTIVQQEKSNKPARQSPVTREEMKKRQLIEVLEQTGGNQSEAARILGVSRVTVWNRIKKYGIGSDGQ
jgi:transcriptional regulator with PAS, ATPase and Fis domain